MTIPTAAPIIPNIGLPKTRGDYGKGYFKHYHETIKHKYWVAKNMLKLYPAISNTTSWSAWMWRAIRHDWTKFTRAEAPYFARNIFKLNLVEYGTPEYKALLDSIRPAIDHHQQGNDHHPEYWFKRWQISFENIPLICKHEMICDWAAAIRRSPNGNLLKSIDYNAGRFGYDEKEAEKLRGLARRLLSDAY